MDFSFEGSALDPLKCSKLSIDEKRELVYQVSKCAGASEMLQSWSRQEILQILCVEMGKERKYTGLTKLKIIEHLLKLVSEKKAGDSEIPTDTETESSPAPLQRCCKRQRKTDNPSRITVPVNYSASNNGGNDLGNTICCKNSACRAALKQDDAFCKRCSCCICYKYDDNKDPSLWLTCSSEPPFESVACGMSCHLDCALKHENSGIGKDGYDGSFRCIACWKVNDLLGCWRKQLLIAKDTRRVDILCYRLSLSQKLLNPTGKYRKLYQIVDGAVKQLQDEVGPLSGLAVKMGRGIVNRLSSGPEVQKGCALALMSLDKMVSTLIVHQLPPAPVIRDINAAASAMIRFEDVNATSLAVILGSEGHTSNAVAGYKLWHCSSQDRDYPTEPTCTLFLPSRRFVVRGLSPAREYRFKVVSFNDGRREMGICEARCCTRNEVLNFPAEERSQSPATNCSSLSNPSSVEDETNHNAPCGDHIVNRAENPLSYCKDKGKIVSANLSNGFITRGGDTDKGRTRTDAVPLLDEEQALQMVTFAPSSDGNNLQIVDEMSTGNRLDTALKTSLECVPFAGNSEANLPITPNKLEINKDVQGRHSRSKSSSKDLSPQGEDPQDVTTSKKRSGERQDEECVANGHSDRDFEYYVKIIRWLECDGHIEKNFRQKFLTWYSLRATPQEMRVVKAFVDTFIQDPASLAEQLVDTFSDSVSSRKPSAVPAGFCMKLWH
ncbi:VIN3-like protein 2 [Euphorbia lathyris]|uniref:VIN3-like protein 2 n=1 Tax=Euphorbia lathyris TaxID=212925 RepID=UPI0033141A90